MTLVAPRWPQAEWYADLHLLVDIPRHLPLTPNLLKQEHSGRVHKAVAALQLHSWTLSSDFSEKGFQEKLQKSLPILLIIFQPLPRKVESSWIGAVKGMYIPSKQLERM